MISDFSQLEALSTDVLVIGAGAAGCRAAIAAHLAGARVLLIDKGRIGRSGNSIMAESAYNAPEEDPGSVAAHITDTIKAGADLNNRALVERLAADALRRYRDLESYGCRFSRDSGGRLVRRAQGGASQKVCIGYRASTGKAMMGALQAEIRRRGIPALEGTVATALRPAEDGGVAGAQAFSLFEGRPVEILAGATVIATGGLGGSYPVTSNARGMVGDGLVLALESGAELQDLEQVQFHLALHSPQGFRGTLINAQLLSEGARLYNGRGDWFMPGYAPEGERATRDAVARAISAEIAEGRGTSSGGVWLDCSTLPLSLMDGDFAELTALLSDRCGFDIRCHPMEVSLAAHFSMGGIRIDESCRTNVRGLLAAGEAAGGLHGANRLGGNALPETQVFGAIAGETAAAEVLRGGAPRLTAPRARPGVESASGAPGPGSGPTLNPSGSTLSPYQARARCREIAGSCLGPRRSGAKLSRAIDELEELESLISLDSSHCPPPNYHLLEHLEVRNAVVAARAVASAALLRRESRGSHYRTDFPGPDPGLGSLNTVVRKTGGRIEVELRKRQ